MSSKPPRLLDVLRQERDAVIDAWAAAGSLASSLGEESRQQLRDEFLALLIMVLDAAEQAKAWKPQDLSNPDALQEIRRQLGIEEFVHEFALLKEAAFTRLFAAVEQVDGAQAVALAWGFDRLLLVMVQNYARSAVHFTSIISHDLRSPLQAVMGAAGVLRRQGSISNQQNQLVDAILRSSERASRLVDDMLDFSQIRFGGLSLRPADTDLRALARDVVNEIKLGHPQRKLILRCSGDSRGCWDADRIAQVMTNLLRNALHYSPPETTVRMTIRGASDAVKLTVHNGGPPIPEKLRPHLFLPMVYGIETERPGGSLGLGLYIVKSIVVASGGTVDVHSSETEGTTFTVVLPRALPGG